MPSFLCDPFLVCAQCLNTWHRRAWTLSKPEDFSKAWQLRVVVALVAQQWKDHQQNKDTDDQQSSKVVTQMLSQARWFKFFLKCGNLLICRLLCLFTKLSLLSLSVWLNSIVIQLNNSYKSDQPHRLNNTRKLLSIIGVDWRTWNHIDTVLALLNAHLSV